MTRATDRTNDDVSALLREGGAPPERDPARELSGVLSNLVRTLRAMNGGVNKLGLEVNVALRAADAVLKRYPPPAG